LISGHTAGEGSFAHLRKPQASAGCDDPVVTTRRRTNEVLEGDREAARIALNLGAELRAARRRARLTQEQLGRRVGLGTTRISELERGLGASAPVSIGARLGMAISRPLAMSFSRDLAASPEPADAGHLAGQELVLRLARQTGRTGVFEMPVGSSATPGVVDVAIRDDIAFVVMLIEIWNRMLDLGSASRSTSRKVTDVAAMMPLPGFRVASCWLLVDNAANRAILRRFPEIFRARFSGSSARWTRAIVHGQTPPVEPGVAWIDPRSGRITQLRIPR